MSTALSTYAYMNLAEAHKRANYDDSAAVIGEIAKMNEILGDLLWRPSTNGLYNKQLQATRLGSGTFGSANAPVATISSQAEEFIEPVKLYEADSIIDERVLDTADDPRAVRDSEDMLNFEGFLQGWIAALFHNDPLTTIDGLKSLDKRRAALGTYCLGASGTGSDLSSVWLIEHGARGLHLVYPENSGAPGIRSEDRGRHRVTAPTGTGDMWAWIRHYSVYAGLVLRNERALCRLANIETAGSSNLFSPDVFIQLKNRLPSAGKNAYGYANRTVKAQIEANAYNKTNAAYSLAEIAGFGPVVMVAGVPIHCEEALLDTETALT